MTGEVRAAAIVLSALGLLAGIAGLVVSSGQELLASEGARVGAFFHLNPFGAILTAALGSSALVAAAVRQRMVVTASAAGWLAAAALTVVQSGREPNWLGGTASTLSFFLGMGAGLLALAVAPDSADEIREGR